MIELLDGNASQEMCEELKNEILKINKKYQNNKEKQVFEIERLIVRPSGPFMHVFSAIHVSNTLNLEYAHQLCNEIEIHLRSKYPNIRQLTLKPIPHGAIVVTKSNVENGNQNQNHNTNTNVSNTNGKPPSQQ